MMIERRRVIFSVVEAFDDGKRHFEVDWHPDMMDALDELSPKGELTDQLIDMAEELVAEAEGPGLVALSDIA